jgi:hypothetical protein
MERKYIMTEYGPVIFDKRHNHCDVAYRLGHVDSAGFCEINMLRKTVSAYGESTSIGVKSDKADAEKLTRFLFG